MADDPFDDFFKRFRRMFREFDSEFAKFDVEKFGRELERRPGVTGFKIEIRDHGDGKPEIKVSRLGERPKEIKPDVYRPSEVRRKPQAEIEKPIKCMLETNVAKVEKLDEVLLTMQAPGVKKEGVDVRQLGRALEIVARKPTGEAYFATFELPSDAVPSGLHLEVKEGMLVIKVPRRRRLPQTGVR
jgi:HSP20 family molecular chaperone IbpA